MEVHRANKRLNNSVSKELSAIEKAESRLQKKSKVTTTPYLGVIESKIPDGMNNTLQISFIKAFEIIFKHGVGIIEKTYSKEEIAANYDIQNYAIDRKGGHRELRRLKNSATKSNFVNMSITAVEGIGLGTLGIGIPDIVLFIGMILKGIYEVALRYGYSYDSSAEKYVILKMMGAALSKSDEWERRNKEVDEILISPQFVSEEIIKDEIEKTAKLFATDMLVLKFIQGLPIVGVVGGVFNPIYYNKILHYVGLKYHKRYLLDKLHAR